MTVIKDNWREVSIRLERGIGLGVEKVGFAVEKQILGNITSQSLVDTGNYRRSWATRLTGKNSAEVGSPVVYGPYLEYGTRFMRARAHVVPAAKTIGASVARFFGGIGS